MTKAEKLHKDILARMACRICVRLYGEHEGGNVELHHLRTGGWGKGNYMTLIPLCTPHHTGRWGVHGMGTKGFESFYGVSQRELLDETLEAIA